MTFKKGVITNPEGRPRGIWQPKTRERWLREVVGEKNAQDIVRTAVSMALDEKPKMIELLLPYFAPPSDREDVIDLPELKSRKTMEEKVQCVLDAVADKRITASQAHQLMSLFESKIKIMEIDEFRRRLELLESK